MANHKSAAKRARQSERRNEVNSRRKSTVRTYEKRLRKAISENKTEEAGTLLKAYSSKVMKAATQGVFSTNHAARKISRLSKQLFNLTKSA